MVGIEFAKRFERIVANAGRIAYAFPASVAERELGIRFGNTPPVAVIKAPSRVARSERRVELHGADSYDPDNDPLTFLWEQENTGPRVSIVNPTSSKAYFDAPSFIPSRVIFKLTVKDSKGETDEERVIIDVGPTFSSSPPTPTPDDTAPPSEESDSDPEPDPEPEPPPVWRYTGATDGFGPSFRRERRRGSETEWESDPQPDPWGPWSDTGRYISSGQLRSDVNSGHESFHAASSPA